MVALDLPIPSAEALHPQPAHGEALPGGNPLGEGGAGGGKAH